MNDYGITPEPAQWALDAGLPEPSYNEGFIEYVTRLGFDARELLIELTERTICCANLRLNSRLQMDMPAAFSDYVTYLAEKHRCRPEPVV